MTHEFDYAVVGGGLVGSCIAYGLSKRGGRVAVIDEGDRAFRASRGNFGLVWVQGKGWDFPAYAEWTRQASALWPELQQELQQATGVDVALSQTGGMEFCLEDAELVHLQNKMQALRAHTNGRFEYRILDHAQTRERVPEVSRHVVGSCYCPHDGHVNPLYLLGALHQRMDQLGMQYLPNRKVTEIRFSNDSFIIETGASEVRSDKVVLCAGLANGGLASALGIHIPVKANRGQLLITEKVKPFLDIPTLHVRQTAEGGLQIGDSAEDVGLDDNTSNEVLAMLAARAAKIFPLLEDVNIVRAWAALRVMTPDGKPVYQQSAEFPGAFAIACHSGVTLAAAHAGPVADWIAGDTADRLIPAFGSGRFDV